MHTTQLRKVGGSVMLTVPPALLEILNLQVGAAVEILIEGNRLIIEPYPRKRYTLDELLSSCDASQAMSEEEKQWTSESPIGRELI